jgi:hypothetical protein
MDSRAFGNLDGRVYAGISLCNMSVMYFTYYGWNLVAFADLSYAWTRVVKLLLVSLWLMMNGLAIRVILHFCMTCLAP